MTEDKEKKDRGESGEGGKSPKENLVKVQAEKASIRRLVSSLLERMPKVVERSPVTQIDEGIQEKKNAEVEDLYKRIAGEKNPAVRKALLLEVQALEKELEEPGIRANFERGQQKREAGIMLDQWAKIKLQIAEAGGNSSMSYADFLALMKDDPSADAALVGFFDKLSEETEWYYGKGGTLKDVKKEKRSNLDTLLGGAYERRAALAYITKIVEPIAQTAARLGGFDDRYDERKFEATKKASEEMRKVSVIWKHLLSASAESLKNGDEGDAESRLGSEEIDAMFYIENQMRATELNAVDMPSVWDIIAKHGDPDFTYKIILKKDSHDTNNRGACENLSTLVRYGIEYPNVLAPRLHKILETLSDVPLEKRNGAATRGFVEALQSIMVGLGAELGRGHNPKFDVTKFLEDHKEFKKDDLYDLLEDIVVQWIKAELPGEVGDRTRIVDILGDAVDQLEGDFDTSSRLPYNLMYAEVVPWIKDGGGADKDMMEESIMRGHALATRSITEQDAYKVVSFFKEANKRLAYVGSLYEKKRR